VWKIRSKIHSTPTHIGAIEIGGHDLVGGSVGIDPDKSACLRVEGQSAIALPGRTVLQVCWLPRDDLATEEAFAGAD